MSVIIKVCGITRPLDARLATELGADWIGINFWPGSKRGVQTAVARDVADAARHENRNIKVVGVFVNQSSQEITEKIDAVGLDYVQLHGEESPAQCQLFANRCIKAIPLANPSDINSIVVFPCPMILVDTPSAGYGGSGRTFDWKLARAAAASGKHIILAGGLTPENVQQAIATVSPFGVDVASGVESGPGIKNREKMKAFIRAARTAKHKPANSAISSSDKSR